MSTRDKGGGDPSMAPPEELRLALGLAPANASIPSSDAPTPGAALAGARVPGGPTLPDWDPVSLAGIASQLANELFAAPPVASVPSSAGMLPFSASMPSVMPAIGAVSMPSGMPAIVAASMPSIGSAVPATASAPTSSTPIPTGPSPDVAMATTAPSTASAPSERQLGAIAPSEPVSSPSPFSLPLSFGPLSDVQMPSGTFPLLDVVYEPPQVGVPEAQASVPSTALAPVSYELQPVTGLSLGTSAGTVFDPHAIRREFPILQEQVHGKRLVWLDNAATTQKPQAVIDRLSYFYERENSNIHRAAHTLAARATAAYERARESVRRFINAPTVDEIIFVRGTTEGINLIAQSWGRRNINEGDEIVITWLEHHANIVPWQMLCAERGARLRIAPVDDRGQIILEEYEKLLGPKTRLVSMTQVSNALGTVTPAREMIELAHRYGAKVVVDGAQSVSHMRVDVQQLDCDFFVFSGHKVFGPTGIGVVFGKSALLEAMPPWQGGGNMIQDVTFERTTYQGPPARFEAGTGNIGDAVGLGAALDWLSRVGVENVARYEHELLEYATPRLASVPGLTLIGTAPDKAGVISFVLAGQKTEEVGGMLDKEGIAVRSGHHCAQPILRRFGLEATVRASLAPYNTCEDIDALVAALHRIQAGHGALR
jgi:cysteine desulfurase/selenocysteine lyase